MHDRTNSRGSARTAGLALACLVGLLLAGVVAVFIWRGGAPAAPAASATSTPPPPAPNVRELPGGMGGLRQLGGGSKMNITMMDRADPTRIAGEIQADRSVPLENKRYRMDKPRVWIFLKDGRTVHIQADHGEALIPDTAGGRPEDGLLERDVIARIFAPQPEGSRPDPDTTPPLVKLSTQQVRFDGRAGEIRFPDDVVITGDRVDFAGSGVLVVMNEGAERLELLRIESTKSLTLKPGAKEPAHPAPATEPAPTDPTAAPAETIAKLPVETLYAIWCEQAVKVEQASRSLSGERLYAWVRLVDNALPPGAFGPSAPTNPAPAATPAAESSTPLAAAPAAQPQPAPEPATKDSDAPVTLSWQGVFELRPLGDKPEDKPAELANNDIFVRCTSESSQGVTLADSSVGASGTGALVEYAATRREAAIAGNDQGNAVLEKSGAGHATGQRFDVAMNTGRVTSRGRGSLSGDKQRSISWEKEAEFNFALKNGTMGSRLERAMMQGTVAASDGKGTLTGETVSAEFAPLSETKSAISRLTVLGNARATDGKDGSLASDSLEVAFVRRGETEESDPKTVTATGHVRGERQGSILASDSLIAALSRDAKEDIVVTTADAKGAVAFTRDDGVEANADQLTADPIAQTVELRGESARVGQRGSNVKGQFIRLDGTNKRMHVPGPGEFVHEPSAKPGQPAQTAHVTWTRGMTFDDATGIVECEGDATGEMQQGELAKDSIAADKIRVALAPGDANSEVKIEKQDRRLISMLATGKDPASPAKVEVRRYAASDSAAPGPLERLLYLEGPEIAADNLAGTLYVPGAGKLLTLDKRAEAAAPTDSPDRVSSRGSALFTWNESLSLNRRTGTATMRGSTRLVHERLADNTRVELEAAELSAQVQEAQDATDAGLDAPFSGELRSATATGSAWMRYQEKEVSADLMSYDAIARIVDAQGMNGNFVTAFDATSGTPITATRVLWNLAENKFQLMGIQQPIVTPK